jgi:hypothetical protein
MTQEKLQEFKCCDFNSPFSHKGKVSYVYYFNTHFLTYGILLTYLHKQDVSKRALQH